MAGIHTNRIHPTLFFDNFIIPIRKFAYAFLLGGARAPPPKTDYRAGFYSAITIVHKLRKVGSKADMVLMVQVSASSKEDRLTEMEERILKTMNIKLVYVPKFASKELENFYGLVMEKFRILSLTDYSRGMFLDYDIFPICNLDYIFDLTEPMNPPHLLNENVILGWKNEPCNAGLSVLRPNQADYKPLRGIILAGKLTLQINYLAR
jgi:hypothetical protein